MPRIDGTGPMGQGAMTGRGDGKCQEERKMIWCGRRFGANFRKFSLFPKNGSESLEEKEKALLEELAVVRAEKEALQ